MADLDRLQIQIEASAAEAMPALDDVINKLTNLNNALRGVGNAGKSFQKSMTGLSNTSIILGRSVGSGFGKALTKGIEGSIQNALKGVGSIIKNISKMAVIGIPSLGIKGFQLMGSGFKLVGKGALAAASGIKTFASFLKGAHTESKNLTSVLMGLYMRLWGLKKAASAFVGIAKRATDFVESYHYFETAFAKIGQDAADSWSQYGYDSAEAYAKSFKDRALGLTELMSGYSIDSQGNASLTGGKSLGMDPEMLMNYQAQYGQMANGLGLVSESAFNASKALTMLGADWSSLRNIDFSTSYEKMASALAGQSRAVRSLGIDITQATLQQYAYAAGISASVSEMSQAAKAELRLIAILDQSRVAWGDMAKTLNTPANQMRLLQQNAASLARTIGNLMIPVLAKVLPYINGVVLALQRLFAWLGSILGINVGEIATGMGGMADEMEDFGDSLVEGIEQAEDDSEDLLDDLKEAKKTILGFDELNVLNAPYSDTKKPSKKDDDDSKKWNPADMGKLDSLLDSLLAEYEKKWLEAFNSMTNRAQQIADAIVNAFKSKDWYGLGKLMASGVEWALGKIYEFLDPNKIYPKIKEITDAVTTVINSFVENFPADLFGRTLGRMLNTYVFTMNQLYDGIDWPSIGQKLATAFLGLLDEVDPYELGRLLTQKFRAAVSIFVGFFSEMQGQWDDVGRKLGTMISGALSNVHPEDIAFVLSNAINAGIHILAGLIETFPWDEVSDGITTGINDMIDWVEWDNLGATLGLALMKITTTITRILTGIHWEDLGRGMGAGLLRFVNAIDTDAPGKALSAAITAVLDFLYGGINEFRVGGGFTKLGEMTSGCINAVLADQTKWDALGTTLDELLKGALEFMKVTEETIEWKTIADNVHQFIKNAIESKNWDEAFDVLSKWLKDICVFIRRALPTQEEWKTIGFRIGYYLQKIDWADVMRTVIKAIKDMVVGLWEGLGETFAGRIIQGIIIYKVASTVLGPITAQIGNLLVTSVSEKLAIKVSSMLGLSLSGGATRAAANVSANLEPLTSAISSTLGSTALFAGGIYGFAQLCGLAQQAGEASRGLNGKLTEVGTTLQDVTSYMITQSGPIKKLTNEQREEIVKMQDAMETAGASNEEMAAATAEALTGYGFTAEQIDALWRQTEYGIRGNVEQTQFWESVVAQMPATVEESGARIDLAYANSKDAVNELFDAVAKYSGQLGLSQVEQDTFNGALGSMVGESVTVQEAYDLMRDRCEKNGIAVETLNGLFALAYPEAVSTAATATEQAKTSITQSTEDIKNKASSDATEMMNAWSNGAKGAMTDSVDAYEDAKKRIGTATEETAEKVETEAGNAAEGAKTKTTQGLNDVVGSIENKAGDFTKAGKTVGEAAGSGTATGITDKKTDVSTSADEVVESAKNSATTATSVFSLVGGSAMEAMKLGFADKRDSVKDNLNAQLTIIKNNVDTSIFTSVGNDIVGKIAEGINNSSLYSAGQALMSTLQAGLYSMNIVLPHINKGGDDRYYYGDGAWFDIPWFSVNWYAKGGLATAPTIAGIGEAGQEAVLPLTNKRAMANIADAIVSGGGLGMSHDDMVEAVATGVAMAMAQNPQTVELVVNSVLKTDDEKLAQSVSRGRARLDQRFNTVSAY